MQANLKQLNLIDIYENIEQYFEEDKLRLIKLFESYLDLDDYIPQSFYTAYYKLTGHPRNYKLSSMLCALVT